MNGIKMPQTVEWKVAIPDGMTAAELGAQDAREGKPCDPDAYWDRGDDIYGQNIKDARGAYVLAYLRAQ